MPAEILSTPSEPHFRCAECGRYFPSTAENEAMTAILREHLDGKLEELCEECAKRHWERPGGG